MVEQCNQLEQVQYRAGRIVSGAINRTSKELVYSELGWPSLAERRKTQRLTVFHKIVNGDTPKYLQDVLPAPTANRENLRSEKDVPKIHGMAFFEKTFIPKSITEWNDLDKETKSANTSTTFSKMIKKSHQVPPWFSHGARSANIWHARLRMKCSQLCDDLFSHIHVIDSPACACGFRRETSKHFLLDCPLYTEARDVMISDLHLLNFKPTVSNLLSGCTELPNDINQKAVDIVQRFLVDIKRFS